MKHLNFFIISIMIMFIILNAKFRWVQISSLNMVALILSSLTELTGQSNQLVWATTAAYSSFSSVERLKDYVEDQSNIEREWNTPKAPVGWPYQGSIKIENLWVRYREDLDPVLRGVSFDIKAGEKIGFVGRTGSGKSTLFLSLLRVLEKMDVEGENGIKIDGISIDKLGLHEVRRNVCIVPQDPFIMEGSLKYNIDPMGEFSDEAVEQVLTQIGFFETLTEVAQNLGGTVANPHTGSREPLVVRNEIDQRLKCTIIQSSNLSLG